MHCWGSRNDRDAGHTKAFGSAPRGAFLLLALSVKSVGDRGGPAVSRERAPMAIPASLLRLPAGSKAATG